MRRLAILLCAAVLAVGAYVPTHLVGAKPAAAIGNCTGTVGTIYPDTRLSGGGHVSRTVTVTETTTGAQSSAVDDLYAFYTIQSNGFCYEGYLDEVSSDSGQQVSMEPHVRAWDPAGTLYDWDYGHVLSSTEADIASGWSLTLSVNMAITGSSIGWRTIGFGAHGGNGNPGLPRASNISGNEGVTTWNFWPYSSYQGNWYDNFNVA